MGKIKSFFWNHCVYFMAACAFVSLIYFIVLRINWSWAADLFILFSSILVLFVSVRCMEKQEASQKKFQEKLLELIEANINKNNNQ